MARARGANAVMAMAFNSGAYGTVPANGFRKLPFVTSDLGETQGLIENDILGFGRDPQDPSRDVVNNDGNVVVPVDLRNFGDWLKLLLGAPTSSVGADDENIHVFASGAVTLPDAAIEIGLPQVPHFGMNYGVMANSLAIPLQRSGPLNATLGLIAQGEAIATSTAAGTPTEREIHRFSQFSGQVLVDGADAGDVVSGNLNFSNGLDKVEVIRPDGRIAGADPGMIAANGDIVVRFKDTDLLDMATAGTPVSLSFGWTFGALATLTFVLHRVFLPKPKLPINGPGGVQASFAYQAAEDPDLHKTMTATLVNDVAAY